MNQQESDAAINNPVVTGTIKWPTIKNRRLTLFDLMDQLKEGLPPHFRRQLVSPDQHGDGGGSALSKRARGRNRTSLCRSPMLMPKNSDNIGQRVTAV